MNNRDQMHPEDTRNLIIFAVLSILMWLTYDHFVARPHAEAVMRANANAKAIAMANAPSDLLDTAIVKPRAETLTESPRVKIVAKELSGSIDLKGARLDDISLESYYKTVDKKEHVTTLSPAKSPFPRYVESGWVAAENGPSVPNETTEWQVVGANHDLSPRTPVTLQYKSPQGMVFEKTFTVDDESGLSIEDRALNGTASPVSLHPYALATEHGLPEDAANMGAIHEGPIGYFGDRLEESTYRSFKKKPMESFTGKGGWIGLTTKYWLTAIAPVDQGDDLKYRFVSTPAIGANTKDRFQADLTAPAKQIAPGAAASYKIRVFTGAKKLTVLQKYQQEWSIPRFDLAVDFGWFYFLTKPFFLALNFLYKLTGNFGIAIIVFTCCLRVLVFPLANISYRSFAKLRKVSPEMYTLRAQYKDDKVKLQEELVKLYQRHNVNPAAGCLPLIVQIPIFYALYKVLSNTIEMRHAPFFGWIHDLSSQDPTSIFNLFGLIPWSPPHVLVIGAWPLMMLGAMVIQRKISPPPDDPIQAQLVAIMPFFMTFIMAKYASGLVIYWTVNNLLAITQQIIIMKSMGVPVHLFSRDKDKEKLEKAVMDGPIVEPKLEMLEEKLDDAIEGEYKNVTPPKPKKKKKK